MNAVPTTETAAASLSGAAVRSLMLRHKVTIRSLHEKHGLTMKRIREVRATGAKGFPALEWEFLITGRWPDLP